MDKRSEAQRNRTIVAQGRIVKAFWQDVIDELRETHKFTKARTSPSQNWCYFSSGVRGVGYNPSFANQRKCRAEVYIDTGDADENQQLYTYLENRKVEFGTAPRRAIGVGGSEGRRACRVAVYRDGAVMDPVSTHGDIELVC